MTESVLVVGATGTIGSELVRQLAATGRRVKALVRDERKAASIRRLAVPVIGDLAAPETLSAAFKDVERAFVLCPPIAEMASLERNAFDAAAAARVKRMVYLSNYGAGTFGTDPHFVGHAANERHLASLGVDWTVLRPTRFMNFTPFAWSSVLRRNLLLEAGGDGAMTVIDPGDVAAIALLALTTDGHEGRSYDLTSEDSFTARELAGTLSRALGFRIAVFDGDAEELHAALVAGGAPEAYAGIMVRYFATVAAGHWQVTDTAAHVLGRRPRSYDQWLERNLPRVRNQQGDI